MNTYLHRMPFFVFEGGEGSGKSTIIKEVAALLGDLAVRTREPGGTPEAERIREVLLSPEGRSFTPEKQLRLFFEARDDHMRNLVFPALEAGKIVLSDRGDSATWAYQVFAQDRPDLVRIFWEERRRVYSRFEPACYIIFDGRPEIFHQRVVGRGEAQNHFDQRAMGFHQKVREGLLDFTKQPNISAQVINAELSKDDVTDLVMSIIRDFTLEN